MTVASSPAHSRTGFATLLAEALADDVLARFLRYVQIDTRSQEGSESFPSTAKQLDLARVLVDELRQIGLDDVHLGQHGYVTATLQATPGQDGPAIGLIAHMDTSPEAEGAGVKPQIWRNYQGGDITLPGDPHQLLRPDDMPALHDHVGHDLVTSDGATLLGADDKGGAAAIVAAVAYLKRHPEIAHGPIKVGFTPDEEIGQGTRYFDIAGFGAVAAYTVDGHCAGEVEDETFSASAAVVTIRGHNTHPGTAKGKMVNSIKLAAQLLAKLPPDALSPETTEERQGYIHPMAVEGSVEHTTLRFILRDFDEALLAEHEALLRRLAHEVEAAEPRAQVSVEVTRSYRNMKEYLKDHPRVTEAAEEAVRRAGLTPRRTLIRGGTDGARLSEQGLPTPNLSAGGHNVHSVREWTTVQDLANNAATLVHLAQVWTE
ncbi:MAG: Tripeptide aminopeptidase [uncultured Chloroflexi bacterium]|uniref:Peptidase T n=1 Tax=uncultured Chloroflexota bacterium TaxID=166587 RepID=A0A6J4ICX3_9CHLR|nr:MAG: Tripeptide aminopeptidase [uncultured Chloroflexota bacterium]